MDTWQGWLLAERKRLRSAADRRAFKGVLASQAALGPLDAANATSTPYKLPGSTRLGLTFSIPVTAGDFTVTIGSRTLGIPTTPAGQVIRLGWHEEGRTVTVRRLAASLTPFTWALHSLDEWMRAGAIGNGNGAAGFLSLVSPGSLSYLTLQRAQASGAKATALAADGLSWLEYAADVPRFHDVAQRLLIEGQRTNSNRNPRVEGSPPTYWLTTNNGGLTISFVDTGVEDGIAYVTYGVTGTPSTTFGALISPDQSIAAADAQTWTARAFVGLDPGYSNNVAGMTFSIRNLSNISDTTGFIFTPTTAALRTQSVASTRTNMPVGSTNVQGRVRFSGTIGTPVDFRIRIGHPIQELAPFASTPILPAVGTPAASTRGADLCSVPLSTLGIGAGGACTILWSGLLPVATSVAARIFQIDDGSESNRYLLQGNGTTTLQVNHTLAGVGSTVSAGAFTVGTLFAAGVSIDASGRIAASLNGGAVAAATGGPTSGLTTLRLGNASTGNFAMFGETAYFRVLPSVLSDADLLAAVAAMPLT